MLHYAYLTKIKEYNSRIQRQAKIAKEKQDHESYVEQINQYTRKVQQDQKEAQERQARLREARVDE